MENDQQVSPLTQMRKSVAKLGSSTENYDEPTLMRFLVARSMEPEKAAKMFVQWQKWRASLVPNGFISDSEVPDELEARKIYLQGLSTKGHPVVIIKGSKHFPAKDHLQFKKFVVHLLDKTIASSFKGREIGNEKLIGIFDLQHLSYKNVDVRGTITGFQFLQNLSTHEVEKFCTPSPQMYVENVSKTLKAYYPERLAKCFILHMPRFFESVWRLICRFLEKATLEKIVIVSNEAERIKFMKEVGEEILPEEYGGRANLRALQDVQLAPLDD